MLYYTLHYNTQNGWPLGNISIYNPNFLFAKVYVILTLFIKLEGQINII